LSFAKTDSATRASLQLESLLTSLRILPDLVWLAQETEMCDKKFIQGLSFCGAKLLEFSL